MTNYTKQILRGSFIIFASTVLVSVLGYFIRMILTRKLSVTDYGLFFSVLAFITFFTVFRDFGLNGALVRFIPQFIVHNKKDKIKSIIAYNLIFNLVTSTIICFIILIAAKSLSIHYFKNENSLILLILMTVYFWIECFLASLRNVMIAYKKSFLFASYGLIFNTVLLLAAALSISNIKLLYVFGTAHIIGAFLVVIIYAIAMYRLVEWNKCKIVWSKKLFYETAKYSLPLVFSGMSAILISSTDSMMLTFYSLYEVGIYNVIMPTSLVLLLFGRSFGNILFPVASEMWTKKMKNELANGIMKIQKYSLLIFLPFALVLIAYPELFLKVFFGEEYIIGALGLQILLIGMSMNNIAMINTSMLDAIGMSKVSFKIILAGGICNLILNIILIPIFMKINHGFVGAATASSLSFGLMLIYSTKEIAKYIPVTMPWKQWGKTAILSIICVFFVEILKRLIVLNVFVEAFICISITGIAYLLLAYSMKLISYQEIIKWIKEFVRMN